MGNRTAADKSKLLTVHKSFNRQDKHTFLNQTYMESIKTSVSAENLSVKTFTTHDNAFTARKLAKPKVRLTGLPLCSNWRSMAVSIARSNNLRNAFYILHGKMMRM